MTRFRLVLAILALLWLPSVLSAQEEVPNCLSDAQVGEWVRYKMKGSMELYVKIVDVDGKRISIETTTFLDGKPLKAPQPTLIDLDMHDPAALGGMAEEKPEIGKATATVGDLDIECVTVKAREMEAWYSNDVPVYGLVKMIVSGEVTQELVAWGGPEGVGGTSEGDPKVTAALSAYLDQLDKSGFDAATEQAWEMYDLALQAMDAENNGDICRHLRSCAKQLDKVLEIGASLRPETDEVKGLHAVYQEGMKLYQRAFREWADGIEKKDAGLVDKSAESILAADQKMGEFEGTLRRIDPKLYEKWMGEVVPEGEEEEGD